MCDLLEELSDFVNGVNFRFETLKSGHSAHSVPKIRGGVNSCSLVVMG